MRLPALHASLVLVASLLPSAAFSQSVITNWTTGSSPTNQFNTNSGYLASGSSLDGQPTNAPPSSQWQTTDPLHTNTGQGSTSLVAFIENWTPGTADSGNNSVYWGGYNAADGILPGATNPSIYYSFNSVLASPSNQVTYSVDFGIFPSQGSVFTNRDSFGISLLGASGASLASFVFDPLASANPNFLGVLWERNGTNVAVDGAIFKPFSIEYGALYRITATAQGSLFDMSISGLKAETSILGVVTNYSVLTNATIISGGTLSAGFTAADFQRASIDWRLSSGANTQPGNNYMIVTSASVQSTGNINYATWLGYYSTMTGTNAYGGADPDGDGFDNNLEYAFGGNPLVPTPTLMTVVAAGTNAVFSWVERKNPPGGVSYEVQQSSNLAAPWLPATGISISSLTNTNGVLIPVDYVRKEFVVPALAKSFYRVRASVTNN